MPRRKIRKMFEDAKADYQVVSLPPLTGMEAKFTSSKEVPTNSQLLSIRNDRPMSHKWNMFTQLKWWTEVPLLYVCILIANILINCAIFTILIARG